MPRGEYTLFGRVGQVFVSQEDLATRTALACGGYERSAGGARGGSSEEIIGSLDRLSSLSKT